MPASALRSLSNSRLLPPDRPHRSAHPPRVCGRLGQVIIKPTARDLPARTACVCHGAAGIPHTDGYRRPGPRAARPYPWSSGCLPDSSVVRCRVGRPANTTLASHATTGCFSTGIGRSGTSVPHNGHWGSFLLGSVIQIIAPIRKWALVGGEWRFCVGGPPFFRPRIEACSNRLSSIQVRCATSTTTWASHCSMPK